MAFYPSFGEILLQATRSYNCCKLPELYNYAKWIVSISEQPVILCCRLLRHVLVITCTIRPCKDLCCWVFYPCYCFRHSHQQQLIIIQTFRPPCSSPHQWNMQITRQTTFKYTKKTQKNTGQIDCDPEQAWLWPEDQGTFVWPKDLQETSKRPNPCLWKEDE